MHVVPIDFSTALLVIYFRVLICLFLFLDSFETFFRRNSLISSTSVFFSSFCYCLLFQLKKFLLARLPSFIFSSWSRSLYGFIFFGVAAVFMRFIVVCHMWLEPCVFLVLTLIFRIWSSDLDSWWVLHDFQQVPGGLTILAV